MQESLFSALAGGVTVITANRRLARALRAEFDGRMAAAGVTAWAAPDVLPWGAWLQRLWDDAPRHAALLAPHQEQAVWERIVAESEGADSLLDIPATAKAAREAWDLSQDWRIPLDHADWDAKPETAAFRAWARRFGDLCAARGWQPAGSLAAALSDDVRSGAPAPRRILLAGFDEFTPQQEELLDALRGAGCRTECAVSGRRETAAVRAAFADSAAELEAAAWWARSTVEAGGAPRAGIVVRSLEELREKAFRIFSDVLHPDQVLPESGLARRCFNVSLGDALSEYPVVLTALLILDLARGPLPLPLAGSLLRSPHLAGAEAEISRRALLDAELRRRGRAEIDLGGLLRAARQERRGDAPAPWHCPMLAGTLAALRLEIQREPDRQEPSRWAAAFSRMLEAAGWPGQRQLDSEEYQTVQAWSKLLDDFASLDAAAGPAGMGHAIQALRRMASERLFQPESPDAPVQILGMLEAAGSDFDHLWVLGLDDEHWPPPASPNPFLPLALARRLGVPHSSASRELEFARKVTSALLAAAPSVVVSYPLREDDRDLRPSPLIAHLPLAARLPEARHAGYADAQLGSAVLEAVEDWHGPALPEAVEQRGGAAVFRLQSACPFRAFAELRLGARPLEAPAPGLDPRMRGTILHAALAAIWGELRDHATLTAASEQDLRALILRAVREAIGAARSRHGEALPERLAEMEQDRLGGLLLAWLEYEKRRPPFEVTEPEQDRSVVAGGVAVRARIDRIDRLPDGRHVIIDYKSGVNSPSLWAGERPEDPQLPLYCVTNQAEVAALAFAQVRRGQLKFRGLAREAGLLPGVPAIERARGRKDGQTWEEQLAHWRRIVDRLGRDFREGRANVDPREAGKACETCSLTSLCRVREILPAANFEAEEEEGDD